MEPWTRKQHGHLQHQQTRMFKFKNVLQFKINIFEEHCISFIYWPIENPYCLPSIIIILYQFNLQGWVNLRCLILIWRGFHVRNLSIVVWQNSPNSILHRAPKKAETDLCIRFVCVCLWKWLSMCDNCVHVSVSRFLFVQQYWMILY